MNYIDVIDPGPKLRRSLDISVSGLDCETEQHMLWTRTDLKIGDRIEIAVVDAPSADLPKNISEAMTQNEIVKDTRGRIRARRKALLNELKNLDRNDRACLKGLNIDNKKHRTTTRGKKSGPK
jgi:hypothetical protein